MTGMEHETVANCSHPCNLITEALCGLADSIPEAEDYLLACVKPADGTTITLLLCMLFAATYTGTRSTCKSPDLLHQMSVCILIYSPELCRPLG